MTEDGIKKIIEPIKADKDKLEYFVVGKGTLKAFEAFQLLQSIGVDNDRLRINLGKTRATKSGNNPYLFYHPMMHSKIYYFKLPGNQVAAIIGSHNVTKFAMAGDNAEVSVLVEGSWGDQFFVDLRNHIDMIIAGSQIFDFNLIYGYAWWTRNYFQGLRGKTLFLKEAGIEYKSTVIILCKKDNPLSKIKNGDHLFFRAPAKYRMLRKLNTEVHLFILASLPPTPKEALQNLDRLLVSSHYGKITGTHEDSTVEEADVEWVINSMYYPILKEKTAGYQFTINPDELQNFVTFKDHVKSVFEYLYSYDKISWIPILEEIKNLKDDLNIEQNDMVQELMEWDNSLEPWEKGPWFDVIGLQPEEMEADWKKNYDELSSDGDSFILFSTKRKNISKRKIRKKKR